MVVDLLFGVLPIGCGDSVYVFVLLYILFYCLFFLVLESSRRGRERWVLCFNCLTQMSCYCKCSVTIPHGAVGWSVIVVFPDHTHFGS